MIISNKSIFYHVKEDNGNETIFTKENEIFDFILNQFHKKGKEIHFYSNTKPYYEFTNFFPSTFEIDGKKWSTSEHFFQAHKFKDPILIEEVRKLKTPRDTFNFVRLPENKFKVRSDWHTYGSDGILIKESFMEKGIRAKFVQNEKLFNLLMNTKNMILVEHTENDDYWGDGFGKGKKN